MVIEIIPARAAGDAIHTALPVVHRIEFLLPRNCTHMHHLRIERRLEAACTRFGFVSPLICTPAGLMEV